MNGGPPNSLEGEEVNINDLGGGALGGEEEGRTQSQPAVRITIYHVQQILAFTQRKETVGRLGGNYCFAMCGQCLVVPGSWFGIRISSVRGAGTAGGTTLQANSIEGF